MKAFEKRLEETHSNINKEPKISPNITLEWINKIKELERCFHKNKQNGLTRNNWKQGLIF